MMKRPSIQNPSPTLEFQKFSFMLNANSRTDTTTKKDNNSSNNMNKLNSNCGVRSSYRVKQRVLSFCNVCGNLIAND